MDLEQHSSKVMVPGSSPGRGAPLLKKKEIVFAEVHVVKPNARLQGVTQPLELTYISTRGTVAP